jgi:addiction module RelE/StbE family toxin
MELIFTKSFRKALSKLTIAQRKQVENAVERYQADRTVPALRDHALKGKMIGLRAFSAAWNLRVIYAEEAAFTTIILIDTGTHNQVY